jgi:hypothetical protein
MKPLKIIVLILIVGFSTNSCTELDTKEEIGPIDQISSNGNSPFIGGNKLGTMYLVEPSGDQTGVTDAENIEAALNLAKANAGTVYLTDGNPETVDQYYTSRNITIDEFQGSLIGESQDNTLIYAGRKSAEVGFQGTFSSYWTDFGYDFLFPTVLQFYYGVGTISISDLSILVVDEQPCDVFTDEYGEDATHIVTILEVFGGSHDTYIENVRFQGNESTAYGSRYGMNTTYGIHAMPGSSDELHKEGDLIITNSEISNISYGAILFMLFDEGSKIKVKKVVANNVGQAIYSGNLFASSINITDMDINIHQGGFTAIWLWDIKKGLSITGNKIQNHRNYGIGLRSIENAVISDNLIYKDNGKAWWSFGIMLWADCNYNTLSGNMFSELSGVAGGIRMRRNSHDNVFMKNDYTNSGLPGWTENSPWGPGAIFIESDIIDANGNIVIPGPSNNEILESKFPGKRTTICEMIMDLTDDQTTSEYDGYNKIIGLESCGRKSRKMNFSTEKEQQLHPRINAAVLN